jgi:type II secretory ATPase GspE/PulE/Tfp pilus assembly ATPase PilB-like protein
MPLDENVQKLIEETKSGLVLLSSPPDHGKTTTAYQMLRWVISSEKVVVSVEGKPSYSVGGMSRVIASPSKGNYAQLLAGVRAYHPDVLLFDDLSDERAFREVLHYAKNGKLVIATVTAKDAGASLDYLESLGADRAGIGGYLRGVASQRLLKRVHDEGDDTGYRDKVAAYQIIGESDIGAYMSSKNRSEFLSKKGLTMSAVLGKLVEEGKVREAEVKVQKML